MSRHRYDFLDEVRVEPRPGAPAQLEALRGRLGVVLFRSVEDDETPLSCGVSVDDDATWGIEEDDLIATGTTRAETREEGTTIVVPLDPDHMLLWTGGQDGDPTSASPDEEGDTPLWVLGPDGQEGFIDGGGSMWRFDESGNGIAHWDVQRPDGPRTAVAPKAISDGRHRHTFFDEVRIEPRPGQADAELEALRGRLGNILALSVKDDEPPLYYMVAVDDDCWQVEEEDLVATGGRRPDPYEGGTTDAVTPDGDLLWTTRTENGITTATAPDGTVVWTKPAG